MIWLAWYVLVFIVVFMIRILLDINKEFSKVMVLICFFLIPILLLAIERIFL